MSSLSTRMSSLGLDGGAAGGGRGRGGDDKEGHQAERKKIRAAFDLFDRDRKKVVPKEEIGTIMRYLGAYPSEEELTSDILPSLSDDDDSLGGASSSSVAAPSAAGASPAVGAGAVVSSGVVRLDRFESLMLRVLVERLYEPDSEELILQAFRVLDPDNRGYIDEHTMHELLTENEWAFRDKEMEDFLRVAKDPDTNFIHYADYCAMLSS